MTTFDTATTVRVVRFTVADGKVIATKDLGVMTREAFDEIVTGGHGREIAPGTFELPSGAHNAVLQFSIYRADAS